MTRLPKVVGNYSWVKDVCLSARIFEAEEAIKVGFVSMVTENKEKAMESAFKWASLVAEKSPVAVQSTKELLNWSRDHSVQDGMSFVLTPNDVLGLKQVGLRYTGVWNSAALQTSDVANAIGATIAKRKPTFEKL